jgi:hypothetical protein
MQTPTTGDPPLVAWLLSVGQRQPIPTVPVETGHSAPPDQPKGPAAPGAARSRDAARRRTVVFSTRTDGNPLEAPVGFSQVAPHRRVGPNRVPVTCVEEAPEYIFSASITSASSVGTKRTGPAAPDDFGLGGCASFAQSDEDEDVDDEEASAELRQNFRQSDEIQDTSYLLDMPELLLL